MLAGNASDMQTTLTLTKDFELKDANSKVALNFNHNNATLNLGAKGFKATQGVVELNLNMANSTNKFTGKLKWQTSMPMT